MLQTLCLPFLPNILNPNTVFALLRININDLVFFLMAAEPHKPWQ